MKAFAAALLAVPALIFAHSAAAQTQTQLRGSIEEVAGDKITFMVREGETLTVLMTPDTRFTSVSGTTISDIKPGSYVGATAVPAKDGMLRALEVHIFNESQRGIGEGHRPFDLVAYSRAEGSTMTTGTVGADVAPTTEIAQNTAEQDARRILTLTYQGGTQTVIVPDDAPIVRSQPATREVVAPGAKATVTGVKAANGSVTATSISVGTNGLTPPM